MDTRKVGRPLKIDNAEELKKLVNEYFEKTDERKITITGLCLYLGLTKETFYEYVKRDEYKDILNRARLIVENSYEMSLRENGRTGDIFALKNFGWRDSVEVKNDNELSKLDELLGAIKNDSTKWETKRVY